MAKELMTDVQFHMHDVDFEFFKELAERNRTSLQECLQFIFSNLAEGCRRTNYKSYTHDVVGHFELYAREKRHANDPTAEGRLRYPETEGLFKGTPCICTEECRKPCNGTCGCQACDLRAWDEHNAKH